MCYENHLQRGSFNSVSSVCGRIKICQICCKTIRLNDKRKHVCGVSFCGTCNIHLPTNHLCYVQPVKTAAEERQPNFIFLFYDFETQHMVEILGDEEKKIHIPNLCVVQQLCTFCIEVDDISVNCDYCGVREYIFKNNPIKQFVELPFEPRQQFIKVICIAHNSQRFDAQFVFKYIVEKYENEQCTPSVIMNGSKIILLEILHAKFIDSLNYFHISLSSLPKEYDLSEIEKSIFPHLFNTPQNQTYSGPLSPLNVYSLNSMSSKKRRCFLEWYNKQTSCVIYLIFNKRLKNIANKMLQF